MAGGSGRRLCLKAEEIVEIAPNRGACFAADTITVEGRRVGFMYREEPDNPGDSGWRFTSGFESEAYMEDADNFGIYDVNTIANYDPDVVRFLDAPVGSSFERKDGSGDFVELRGWTPE